MISCQACWEKAQAWSDSLPPWGWVGSLDNIQLVVGGRELRRQ